MGGLAGGKAGGTVGGKQGGGAVGGKQGGGTVGGKQGSGTVGGKEGGKVGGKDGGGSSVYLQLDRQTAEALLVTLTRALGSSESYKSTKTAKSTK